MLRAIKFAARFGWEFDAETEAALRELQPEILKASRFRVTEEVFRILVQPHRQVGLRMLKDFGFLDVIYPDWIRAIGDEGFEQVWEYFDRAESAAGEDRFYPMEVLAAGLFVPLLDSVDIASDQYHAVAGRVAAEIGDIARRMDLPKRLSAAAIDLLRGQLYLLFFHDRPKRVRKFVEYAGFDLVWRVHELAFATMPELQEIQGAWLDARHALNRPVGGYVGAPDRRDIFSFRGKTGGGRHERGGGRGGPPEPANGGGDGGDGDWQPMDDAG
jgi:hypothetical protein